VRTVVIVVVILALLVIVALVVLVGRRNQRRARLRERFGPEYDAAVSRGKDRRAVEQRLAELAERRETLEITDLDLGEHDRFAHRWAEVQGRFVDDPGQAVADADGLVNAVLRSRGYPVETFDDRAALVATDHQDVVERYRAAHDTYAGHLGSGSVGTEPLRQAFLQYRDVFDRLNQPASEADAPAHAPADTPGEPAPADEAPVTDEAPVAEEAPVRDEAPVAEERVEEGDRVAAVRADGAEPAPRRPEQ
jgi:hypothetical protein